MIELPVLLGLSGGALLTVAAFAPRHRPAGARPFSPLPAVALAEPDWPQLVAPGSRPAAPEVRRELVAALAALASPWALAILRQVADEDPDPAVAAAAAAALASSSQSLVT